MMMVMMMMMMMIDNDNEAELSEQAGDRRLLAVSSLATFSRREV